MINIINKYFTTRQIITLLISYTILRTLYIDFFITDIIIITIILILTIPLFICIKEHQKIKKSEKLLFKKENKSPNAFNAIKVKCIHNYQTYQKYEIYFIFHSSNKRHLMLSWNPIFLPRQISIFTEDNFKNISNKFIIFEQNEIRINKLKKLKKIF